MSLIFKNIPWPKTRTGWLVLLLCFIGGLVAAILLNRDRERSTLLGADRAFAVEEVDALRKIFLAHRDGYTVTLDRRADGWWVDGRYPANPDVMRNLLHALSAIRVKYQPPEAMEATMIKSLAGRGIKVELYGAGEKPLKTYYVGGATPDERGTYIMMEGADQPYVGELANWEGNLRFRYNLRGDDWRDKTVFALPVEEIQRVSVDYPRQQGASFALERSGPAYAVRPLYPGPGATPVPVARGVAEAYLYGFRSLGAEAFENDNPRRDSIRQLLPFCTVRVQTVEGREREARFFPVQRAGEPLAGPGSPAVERYFLDLDGEDLLLVQDRVFRQLFMGYDFFVPQQ